MCVEKILILVTLVGPLVTKKDSKQRKATTVKDRLTVTFRFLTSGDSFTTPVLI